MERLAGRLADGLVQKGIVIQTDRDFYRFAIESLLIYALNLGTLFLAAILSGKVPECIFFLTVFYPLRTSCGGIHMKTWYSCYVVSSVLLESILLLSGIVHISYLLLLCGFTACSVCIWTMAPCEKLQSCRKNESKIQGKAVQYFIMYHDGCVKAAAYGAMGDTGILCGWTVRNIIAGRSYRK